VKTLIAVAVLLVLLCVPAFAADKPKPEPPDAKWLAAVDKAIASAQEKAVPTPKLLKLAQALIKKGRLIRANEVAALIARKGTDADQATAKKINTAVAEFKGIVGTWSFQAAPKYFSPDGSLLQVGGRKIGRWETVGPGVYELRTRVQSRRIEVNGLTATATITRDVHHQAAVGRQYPGKRVK